MRTHKYWRAIFYHLEVMPNAPKCSGYNIIGLEINGSPIQIPILLKPGTLLLIGTGI